MALDAGLVTQAKEILRAEFERNLNNFDALKTFNLIELDMVEEAKDALRRQMFNV